MKRFFILFIIVACVPPVHAERVGARNVETALVFLRASQNSDGSFGTTQPRLQTGLAILAFLSSGLTPETDPVSPVPKACQWLLKEGGEDGFLGDSEFPMESHAVCALTLAEMIGMASDHALNAAIEERADRALQRILQLQDTGVGAEYYGGWKADPKSKSNDRFVTALNLVALKAMELRARKIPESGVNRALQFLEGSQKISGEGKTFDKSDAGGFSYDAAGLSVISITGAGFDAMNLYNRAPQRRAQAMNWLKDNRPVWYGPQFYYTHYFVARGYAMEIRRDPSLRAATSRYFTRLWELLRDHQNPDGSFQVPPGNAENTRVMGKTYATPMAILILNAERGLLPTDSIFP